VVALQLDICGFTVLSQTVSPMELAETVHLLFSDFDEAVMELKLFKVDTIGDAYIIVGWLHGSQDDQRLPCICTHAHTHARAHVNIHTYTCTYTHAHMHTRTCAYTHIVDA